ncbi:amidohydrolase family protein [Acidobacteria bacterium AH-259-D05]|nr:amidohydrolase family protein [Acidobacteria bacterium AH-259-D05]
MRGKVSFILVIGLLAFLVMSLPVMSFQTESNTKVTVVKAGLLIDGTGNPPLTDVLIWIEGDRITQVGEQENIPFDAVVVDASEQVVIPGLIDTHVHLGEQAIIRKTPDYEDQVHRHLRQNLAFGVTTVFSLGLDRDFIFSLKDRSWESDFAGARILTAGSGFTAVGGHPTQLNLDVPNEIDDSAQARERVQQLAAKKVDGIKIWFARIPGRSDLPTIKAEVARAIIDEAHKHNLKVMAHINIADDTKTLVRAQLDGITHIARDSYDDETLELMARQGTILAPTLVQRRKALIFAEGLLDDPFIQAVLGQEADNLKQALAKAKPETLDSMKKSYEQAKGNVRQLKNAGVRLAVGTDAGTNFAPMGLVTHGEIEAFVDAGLSPMEALVAATRGSAEWAGVSNKVGTVEAGKLADMVILEQSPLLDIRNTRKIVKIILGGRIVDPLERK